jgi:DNA recombination protein RmuC
MTASLSTHLSLAQGITWILLCVILASALLSLRIISALKNTLKNAQNELQEQNIKQEQQISNTLSQLIGQIQAQASTQERLFHQLSNNQRQQDQYQAQNLKTIADSLSKATDSLHKQLNTHLSQHSTSINNQFSQLRGTTETQLNQIQEQVEARLSKGFKQTNETFQSILQRLTIIDQAQKKITELSSEVVSLQEILSDKKSRGAFGEVQLNALIGNMIPEKHYALQAKLSNGKKPDCILYLPEPTGHICIDAKFPLENYKAMQDKTASIKDFKRDMKTHIDAVASKYIIEHETADGAMLFIPAEAIFAEIHANHQDIVDYSYKKRVWLASPTTLMAILTTARAVLKDAATRKQIHIIQNHLSALSDDFMRFQGRMDKLAQHIRQTNNDIDLIQTSSKKITARFRKIESVELKDEDERVSLLETAVSE